MKAFLKQKNIIKIISVMLILCLALSGCSGTFARRTIDFSEMDYNITQEEIDDLKSCITATTEKESDAKFFLQIIFLESRLNQKLSDFYTKSTVLEIQSYLNSDDEALTELQEWVSDETVEIQNLINEHDKVILEGPFAEKYKNEVGDFVFEQMEIQQKLHDAAVVELQKQRDQISIKYNKMLTALTVNVNGTDYTRDELAQANISRTDYMDGMVRLYSENAQTFADMYNEMIQCDTKISDILGFKNAIEMHYTKLSRDYTYQDSEKFFEYVKKYLVPLSVYTATYEGAEYYVEQDRQTTLSNFGDLLKKFDDERMTECYEFMRDFSLIDSKAKENKQSGIAFTASLYSYDAPFIYISWEDDFSSTTTLVHEFGHAFNDYVSFDRLTSEYTLDISEIFSQGLELLVMPYYDDFADEEYADALRESQLAGMVSNSVVFQAMLEEFQITAYQNKGQMTSDEYGKLYYELMNEYGLGNYTMDNFTGIDNSWFRVTHFFDVPFYTISYCTSACVALELWGMSQDDWDKAFETYIGMIDADHEQYFLDFIDEAGLSSPLEENTIKNLYNNMCDEFDIDTSDIAA